MKKVVLPSVQILLVLCLQSFLSGCSETKSADQVQIPTQGTIRPSDAFLERQAAYLAYCDENNGPGQGGIYGQVCPAYTGSGSYNEEEIYARLEGINTRYGSNDFHLNAILRMLYFDRQKPRLPDALRRAMEEAVLGFKYWLDEPGSDSLVWWSENHQILFHTAELLAGQLFPDRIFSNAGMTGAEHAAHALALLRRWLDARWRFGFAEWHSNVYFNEDMPGLINLVDFSEDQDVSTRAAILLDVMAFDMASNYYKGLFAVTHGRTYPSRLLNELTDSTREAAYIMLGLAQPGSMDDLSPAHFTGCFLATSDRYGPPPVLEQIAAHASDSLEHRQRDSIDIEEGPGYGFGYTDFRDVMFWWGMTGYVPPQVVAASFDLVDTYNLWEGGDPWNELGFLRPLVGNPLLVTVSELFEPLTRGVVLETVNTYTYRTPYYQVSCAQDYKPGSWTGQVHVWKATLDEFAYVFTTYPGGLDGDYMGGLWTGGFVPRATFHENVGIVQYRRPKVPLLDQFLFVDYSHAYFPRTRFDRVKETGRWILGRKDDAYVALYSQHPTEWSAENDYELVADAKENVWIVELGDAEHNGTFSTFVQQIQDAVVSIDGDVIYHSPSQGIVRVGWSGPMLVEGEEVDLGPYKRWDNTYCQQEFGESQAVIKLEGRELELDFLSPRRRLNSN